MALLRPVVHLFCDGGQRTLGAAFDHATHRVRHGWRWRGGHRRCCSVGWGYVQHRPQNGVGPVRGQAFEAGVPGLLVQILEIVVRVVGWHVHRLGDGSVHKRLHGLHHCDVVGGRHLQRRHKVVGQLVHVAAQLAVGAPGVVFDRVLSVAAIALALFAFVHPRERWLDTVGGVVGKGKAHGTGGRNGQQVAVANAMLADGLLQGNRQAAGKGAGLQVPIGVKLGERALLLRQRHRGRVGGIAHAGGDAGCHLTALHFVVAQAQHGQGVAHAGKAHADATLVRRLLTLLRQGPEGHVQYVVQSPHLNGHGLLKGFEVKGWHARKAKGVAHEPCQDDGAQIATTVGWQWLLATGVGRGNRFAVAQVIVLVDVVQEQDARLCEVVGGAHHGVPQFARLQGLVDPLAIGALKGAFFKQRVPGFGRMHQLPGLVIDQGLHEGVGHTYRHIEVVPAARRALGSDELHHIWMVHTQYTHLRTAARACTLHRGAGLVKHIDVATGARRHRRRAFDGRATWADAREVIPHTAAAAHGLGSFAQSLVNAGVAVRVCALDAITHRLHKTVDQCGLYVSAGCAHDAARANGTRVQVFQEDSLVFGAVLLFLDRREGARHAGEQVFDAGFARLQVFLGQYIVADGLDQNLVVGGGNRVAFHGVISWE